MVIRHIVLRHLADIFDDLLADHICAESLLQQHIAAVFFVCQDAFDNGDRPIGRAKDGLDLVSFQPVLQIAQAGSALVSLIDLAHHFGLLRDDVELAVCIFFVTVKPVAWNFERPDLCMHLSATPDVTGDGLAFGLRHCAVHRNHEFAVWL